MKAILEIPKVLPDNIHICEQEVDELENKVRWLCEEFGLTVPSRDCLRSILYTVCAEHPDDSGYGWRSTLSDAIELSLEKSRELTTTVANG